MNTDDSKKTNFYFYAPENEKSKLEAVAQAYPDYDVNLKWMEAPVNKWALTLKKEFDYEKIDMDELDESFIPVGEKFGVNYDGYDRPVQRATNLGLTPSLVKPKKTLFGFLKRK
jgi:hypothetical protein